jgi:hypothetical protein
MMSEDWTKWPDENVFGKIGEERGSPASYWRETEIKRRLYLLEKQLLEAQIDGVHAQREAVKAQQEALTVMRTQSWLLMGSIIAVCLSALATLFGPLLVAH